jgi:hypothetical protein
VLNYFTIDNIDPSSNLVETLPEEVKQDLHHLLTWEWSFSSINRRVTYMFNPSSKSSNSQKPVSYSAGLISPLPTSNCEYKLITAKVKLDTKGKKRICLTFALGDLLTNERGLETSEFWRNIHQYEVKSIKGWQHSLYCWLTTSNTKVEKPKYWVFNRFGISEFARASA